MKVTVPCSQCGKSVQKWPSQIPSYKNHFCSTKCHDAFRNRKVKVTCAICGVTQSTKASIANKAESHACGPECLAKLQSQNAVKRWGTGDHRSAKCARCGKEFERKPSQLRKHQQSFCGKECANQGKQGQSPTNKNGQWYPCETCGKPVWRTPAILRPRVFCSRQCAGKGLGDATRGIPRVERILLTCQRCGNPFERLASQLKRGRCLYCSKSCQLAALADAARRESKKRKGQPGRKWHPSQHRKHAEIMRRFYASDVGRAFLAQKSKEMGGTGILADGLRRKGYTPGFTPSLKRKIKERDRNRCQICGSAGSDSRPLAIHHRDRNKLNHNPANLITLCGRCHGRVHRGTLSLPVC